MEKSGQKAYTKKPRMVKKIDKIALLSLLGYDRGEMCVAAF